MPIRITLRTALDFSPFRHMLMRLIGLPVGDSLLLCSGYIWEPASGYSVLNDDLLRALVAGRLGNGMTTVAGKLNTGYWMEFYRNFVIRIRQGGIQVRPYLAARKNWHAKIALKFHNGEPIAGIVGSSNLTGPAFRERAGNWNFEGDVLIWKNDRALNRYFQAPYDGGSPAGDMQLILDPEIHQLDETGQLKFLAAEVNETGLEAFEV